jgi:hypothetical protein
MTDRMCSPQRLETHNDVGTQIMTRKVIQNVLFVAVVACGMTATTAEAAVVKTGAGVGVVVRPGPAPNTAYAYRGAAVARLTPYRPCVGPQVHAVGRGVVVRGY